jgi:hypothetical protein
MEMEIAELVEQGRLSDEEGEGVEVLLGRFRSTGSGALPN